MIFVKDLVVTFSPNAVAEKQALKNITFSIQPGEFVTVVGGNGAGKSTLMGALAGEIPISSGLIQIDETDVTRLKVHQRCLNLARVFQDPLVGTCGDLSISENLSLAWMRGKKRAFASVQSKERVQEFFHSLAGLNLGLENRMDTPMRLLSGGQRQAISLLMTALSPLKVLLLDEHTSALDPRTAEFVLSLTEKIIQEKNLTAFMVTHSLHQALKMGTRTMMLHDGRIILDLVGEKRSQLTPSGLLEKFGSVMADDKLLLQ